MMELTLEIVAQTLFATDVTAAIREINDEVNVIMRLYNYLIALPRAESYLRWPIPGLIRFRKARATAGCAGLSHDRRAARIQ